MPKLDLILTDRRFKQVIRAHYEETGIDFSDTKDDFEDAVNQIQFEDGPYQALWNIFIDGINYGHELKKR